jgi:hypothetical protein
VLVNIILRAISVLHTSSLVPILAYSSIFYTSLIILIIKNNYIFILFIFSYIIATLVLIKELFISKNTRNYIIWDTNTTNFIFKTIACLRILGVPPSLGFLTKIISLKLVFYRFRVLALIFLLFRPLFIYIYIRIILEEITKLKSLSFFNPKITCSSLLILIILWAPIRLFLVLKVSIKITLYLH